MKSVNVFIFLASLPSRYQRFAVDRGTIPVPRVHYLARRIHLLRERPLAELFIELAAGGNLQGDRIERKIVSRHAAIGIKTERYPLSGGSRFRGSGYDVAIEKRKPKRESI